MPPEPPLTISVEEAARLLGVGRGTAYEAARRGQLPTIRIGRRLLVPTARLEEMIGAKFEHAPGTGVAASRIYRPFNGDGPAGNRAEREDARSSSHDEEYS